MTECVPPSSSSSSSSSSAQVSMRTVRRKSIATRSPSACPLPTKVEHDEPASVSSSASSSKVHDLPPGTFGTAALQSLIYATSNDRFPGAPGTLLHRAKLEAARALAAKQREIQREAERREEMKRLGILGVGKKRSSASSNGRFATSPVASDRARRSNAVAAVNGAVNSAAHASNGGVLTPSSSSSVNGGSSTRPARANGRSVMANSIDHNSLPTPASHSNHAVSTSSTHTPNGASSPLLSSSGRLRRPATGSRGASPMPLTAANGTVAAAAASGVTATGGMTTRTRSPVVPALDLDDVKGASGGPALIADAQGVMT